MAYTLEILKFRDGQPTAVEAASEGFSLPDDATAKGHQLVATSSRESGPAVGFRVMDHGGKQIHIWRFGDSRFWNPNA